MDTGLDHLGAQAGRPRAPGVSGRASGQGIHPARTTRAQGPAEGVPTRARPSLEALTAVSLPSAVGRWREAGSRLGTKDRAGVAHRTMTNGAGKGGRRQGDIGDPRAVPLSICLCLCPCILLLTISILSLSLFLSVSIYLSVFYPLFMYLSYRPICVPVGLYTHPSSI